MNNPRFQVFSIILLSAIVLTCPRFSKAQDTPNQPIFDIPNLQTISIDGDPADWADRGFRISVLHSASPRRLPAAKFDAQIRLGWNAQGLLLLADVTDDNILEEETGIELWNGTSVEIFEADAVGGNEHWHALIAPGLDARHTKLRTQLLDHRSSSNGKAPLSITAAARKTPRGYICEALIPWNVLNIDTKPGTELAFQVMVNHVDGAGTATLLWFPTPGADWDGKLLQRVRLAQSPSAPVTAAAEGGYERFRRTRISIAATADAAGTTALVKEHDAILGQALLKPDGRLATAHVSLPMPPIGKAYEPLTVWLHGNLIDTITLPDADDLRKDALNDLEIVADSSVFAENRLPAIDFSSPGAAEDLIGDYRLRTTYYDSNYNIVSSAIRPGRYGAIVEVTPEIGKPFKRYLTLYREPSDFDWDQLHEKIAMQFPPELGVNPQVAAQQSLAAEEFVADVMRDSRHRGDRPAIYLSGLSELPPGALNLPRRLGPAGRNIAWWYALKKKTGDLTPYKYLVHVPAPATESAATKFPLILFLHGSEERGDNLDDVAANGPPKILKMQPDWPFKDKFIVISPQAPITDEDWNPLLLRDLLDEVAAKYPVDPDRVYLTGLSMGGYGSWDMAEWFPSRFAAVAPVCGAGDSTDVARLQDIPIWVFHGGMDPVVPIQNAYDMVQALRTLHGRIRFTIYPDYGHNSWDPAYDDPNLYDWLLKQSRGHATQPPTTTPDTRPATQ